MPGSVTSAGSGGMALHLLGRLLTVLRMLHARPAQLHHQQHGAGAGGGAAGPAAAAAAASDNSGSFRLVVKRWIRHSHDRRAQVK